MIISLNLISEFLPQIKNYSLEDIEKALYKSGIEIERYEKLSAPEGLFYGVIQSVSKVEKSNKLSLCKVFIPKKNEIFNILCGASNVRQDLKVVVALPGVKLPSLLIQEREILGIVSQGMICSYSELHSSKILNLPSSGILELDLDISKSFFPEDLGLNDLVFDLSIPANRPDLFCAWGLAQELKKNLRIISEISFMKKLNNSHLCGILLSNNFSFSDDYLSNLNKYFYLGFNECFLSTNFLIKTKSPYFRCLTKKYLDFLGIENSIDDINTPRREIKINLNSLSNLLGLSRDKISETLDYLKKFDFSFSNNTLLPPLWREDIVSERDVSEEIMRHLTMDSIDTYPISSLVSLSDNNFLTSIQLIKKFWKNLGFFQCTTFNLHESKKNEIHLKNPFSIKRSSLRTHALHELLDVLISNYSHKQNLYPIFEIVEIQSVGWTLNIVVPEFNSSFPMNKTRLDFDLYDLQALLRKSLSFLNQNLVFSKGNSFDPFFSENFLTINSDLGYLGYLKTNLPFKVWGGFVKLIWNNKVSKKCIAPSLYPVSVKDISILVDKNISLGNILSSLKFDFLKDFSLIERYEENKKISYLLRFIFQSSSGTLTKNEIDFYMDQIYSLLEKSGAIIR